MSASSMGRPRRVLVLGAGFIGSAVSAKLCAAGHDVDVVTRSEPNGLRAGLLEGASVLVGPADTTEALADLVADADDVIYCLGSSTPVESEVAPASDISGVLPPLVRVLEVLKHHSQARLSFLSSGGTVYGNATALPIREDAPTKPISSYGILKLACENYVAMYADVHGVRARILRVSNPYGPGQDWHHGQGLVARLLHCAATDSPVTLFAWGEPVRDYIYVDDLATAIAQSLVTPDLPRIINLGSGVGCSSKQLAEFVRTATGSQFEVRLEPPRGYDVEANVLDVTMMKRHLAITTRSLPDGLTATLSASSTAEPAAALPEIVDRRVGSHRA